MDNILCVFQSEIRDKCKKAITNLQKSKYKKNFISFINKELNYNLILDEKTCDYSGAEAYCDNHQNIIGISSKNTSLRVISHEIAHIIQADLGIIKKNQPFSEIIKYEQEADLMSIEITEQIFGKHVPKQLKNLVFSKGYNNKESILWLKDYYGDHPYVTDYDIKLE